VAGARAAFGGDTELETIDGRVPYAVGDRVVIRKTIREAGLFNGSVGTVRGVSGVVLEVERRDGETVRVDTSAHPGVQHGYCSTEYREQGSTRYAEMVVRFSKLVALCMKGKTPVRITEPTRKKPRLS
jgi:ATP-dependent exoDNAse (exonuclease V) alpha subunit